MGTRRIGGQGQRPGIRWVRGCRGQALPLGSLVRGEHAPDNPYSSLIAFVVSGLLLAGSVFGLLKLWPTLRAPSNFRPSYGAVAPDVGGHPFEVRFQRQGWGRTMEGKGTVRFDAGAIQVEGYRTPSPLLQIGIILVLTVIPLILFQVGLGLIPALLLAYFLGRSRVAQPIAYGQIAEPQLAGGALRFSVPGAQPDRVAFVVALSDSERLHREVGAHIPAAG